VTITSPHNEKLKEIRKLTARRRERERAGRFVAEGEDLLAAADAAGWHAAERFCAAGSGLPGIEVAPELLAGVSGLGSGTRTLAVYSERWTESAIGPLCVCLWGVGDPGNIGTVLRSAEAFGASCVALGPGCADPFGPKAVRASMGAVFSVPLARVRDASDLPGLRVALAAGQGVPLTGVWEKTHAQDPIHPTVTLLVGAEREGLPAAVVAAADVIAHIPIRTHSLNAAMAATIALYETSRMARA
jgi:RNA methyltransferase, TrmH family